MELQGPAMTHGLASLCDPVVSVAGGPVTASALHLSPCRPNPTRGPAWIGFTIPARLAGRPIRLDVHDVTGRRVRTLIDAPGVMGPQGVSWDGKDASGQPVAGGVYFMRLSVADESVTGRIVQLR